MFVPKLGAVRKKRITGLNWDTPELTMMEPVKWVYKMWINFEIHLIVGCFLFII